MCLQLVRRKGITSVITYPQWLTCNITCNLYILFLRSALHLRAWTCSARCCTTLKDKTISEAPAPLIQLALRKSLSVAIDRNAVPQTEGWVTVSVSSPLRVMWVTLQKGHCQLCPTVCITLVTSLLLVCFSFPSALSLIFCLSLFSPCCPFSLHVPSRVG